MLNNNLVRIYRPYFLAEFHSLLIDLVACMLEVVNPKAGKN